jgi:glycosyltransferase involved in cell wall biosynthesis
MLTRKVKWPFLLITDSRYRSVGWALINGPIATRAHHVEFSELCGAGYRFAGMTSYLEFPRSEDADVRDYGSLCEAWCHCFRDPDRYLPHGIPRALISVSDFVNYRRVSPERVCAATGMSPTYDFIFAGAVDDWKRKVKNWELAGRCIPRMCSETGLRALVIGTPDENFEPSAQVSFCAPLQWDDFLARLAQARFLFVPSVLDASPRILAEALCLDVPVVVNRRILGGWKYVNNFTGRFFEDERDVVEAARSCLEESLKPRRWYCANYGPYLAGARLLRFLRSIDTRIEERSHLMITEEAEELLAPAQ